MTVYPVPPDEWNKLSEQAHLVAFGEIRPKEMNTFDFALVVANDADIFGYATIIEMDRETAYMQHGGMMPTLKGTTGTKRVYAAILAWLKSKYKYITTRISNQNVPMLKLALSEGLLVKGCDCYPDGVFLHLGWGFN